MRPELEAAQPAPVSTSGFFSGMPSFNSGVPGIGTINLDSPMEWVFWGGLLADLFLIQGLPKWIIAAGILAARYEFLKP